MVRLSLILTLLFSLGCQMAEYKNNERSPHLPVFPEITKDKYISNPYWIRSDIHHDQQKIKLNTGKDHYPTGPSAMASIGTHYRFESDFYLYGMTQGVGAQFDSAIWEKSKLSWGALGGFNQNWGVHASYAQEFGKIFNGNLTAYVSAQRRHSVTIVRCDSTTNSSCAGDGTLGENRVQIAEHVFNFILGLQAGRFKLGPKGNTTLCFRFEAGTHNVLERKIITEWYPSQYENTMSSALVSFTGDLTLW
jgi:hypothetical protein